MKLSDEQFANAREALGCKASGPTEHRGGIRVAMATRATIIPCSDSGRREPTAVVVLNLSDNGVGILNGVPMRNGESFILRLPAVGHRPSGAVLCTVVYSHSVSATLYSIGAQFTRIVSLPTERMTGAPSLDELAAEDLEQVRQIEQRLSQLSL